LKSVLIGMIEAEWAGCLASKDAFGAAGSGRAAAICVDLFH
jgi:hypothetical protein